MKIDATFGSIDIAVSGLRAQNKQMEVISSNIANARTTDNGNGTPYRRLKPVFTTDNNKIGGVEIGDIAEDASAFKQELDPGHPMADENGYVSMPNVDVPVEMMSLSSASRAYEANAAVLKRYQDIVESTLELLR